MRLSVSPCVLLASFASPTEMPAPIQRRKDHVERAPYDEPELALCELIPYELTTLTLHSWPPVYTVSNNLSTDSLYRHAADSPPAINRPASSLAAQSESLDHQDRNCDDYARQSRWLQEWSPDTRRISGPHPPTNVGNRYKSGCRWATQTRDHRCPSPFLPSIPQGRRAAAVPAQLGIYPRP